MSGQYSRTRNLILTLILTRTRTHTLNFAAITPMSENTPKNQQKFLDGEMYLRIYVSEGYETGKCSVRARGRHAGSPSCISLSPLLATPPSQCCAVVLRECVCGNPLTLAENRCIFMRESARCGCVCAVSAGYPVSVCVCACFWCF